jgi:hypothetical protein
MKILSICAVLAALIAGGCALRKGESFYRTGYDFSKVDKVAIVAVEGAVKSETAKNQIAEFFAMELLKRGYAPVGRSQVKGILSEQQQPSIDLSTVEGATQAGKALKVPVVIAVNVPHFDNTISMSAVMIDVQDGSFLWIGIGSGKTTGTLSLSRIFGGGEEGGIGTSEEENQALRGFTSGSLAAGGLPLTLAELKSVQNIVAKICKTLPPRMEQMREKTGFWNNIF